VPTAAPLVRVVRSGLVESVHLGHVVVCDPRGRVLAAIGDPDRLVFSRSSMKPLQAAVSLRRIAEPLPDDLVAVMCASHNGEPVHVRLVRRILRTGGLSERDLGCPPDLPMEPEARRAAAGPRRITHNCSGKHAGMLLACERSGAELATYLEPSHPLQREIVRAVRSATDVQQPAVGVDGCGAPVHGLPLRGMATLFARLARPERLHCAAILDAGIGVAVRIDDGSDRAAAPSLVRALDLLGVLDEGQRARLASVAAPPVLGGGRPVGRFEVGFRLRGRPG
jgi:L-asparaginase II